MAGSICRLAGWMPGVSSCPQLQLTFMAGYKPQANLPFVGVYVAQERGLFQKEGLSVDIQHSGGGADNLQRSLPGRFRLRQ